LLKRPRTLIPTFSSSSATSTNPSLPTEKKVNTSIKQKELIDVEIVKVLNEARIGITHHVIRLLQKQSEQNAFTISKYVLAIIAEINPSTSYIESQIKTLCYFSTFTKQKPFPKISRDDIWRYLDSHRRPEESDPLHKWITTYNLRRIYLLRFFKWLYYPELEHKKRPLPAMVMNIASFKRKEQSTYKPTDLWTEEDDLLFLKYCPNKRDRCYHTIARDSSCRPSEILGLKIKSIVFKTTGEHQYAAILVNGKTGTRNIPLFSAVPYIKDWLDSHPQRGNPNAYLIPSMDRKHRRFGDKMKSISMNLIYREYKLRFFPSLLEDPKVPPEDKQKIRELLQKPWNPYVFRHSALTQKSTILKEHVLRQHAGWSPRSQMHLKYLHYFGNESSETLLESYGIVIKNQGHVNLLKPKQCPNCNEPNKPDSKFCAKCRMVLTYDAYNETIEEKEQKDKDLQLVKERMESIENMLVVIQPLLQHVKPEMLSKLNMVEVADGSKNKSV
jgi:integrase